MTLQESKVYFRDEFVPFSDATISVANTAFMYGLSVFSGLRANWNQDKQELYIFRLKENFQRLIRSCRILGMKNFENNFIYEKFEQIILDLMQINNVAEDAYIRPCIFVDENRIGPNFYNVHDSFYAFTMPLGSYVPDSGMRCMVTSWTRVADNSIPARAKVAGAYVNTALAKADALEKGFDEAIVLDQNGHAVEGSAENLFIVRNNKIYTPGYDSDILEGITRNSVIEIAKSLNYEVYERPIDRTELYTADEVILTGTVARISPVIEIDHRKIGDGLIGPIAIQLQNKFTNIALGKESEFMDWVTKVPKN